MSNKNRTQEGQALIIIVMVMVLALATGLAVSTRSSSTVHQTANLANSEQALATAESAAEELLKRNLGADGAANASEAGLAGFKTNTDGTGTTCATFPCYKTYGSGVTASRAEVTVDRMPLATNADPFKFYLEKDDVQQVLMYTEPGGVKTPYTGDVSICWQKTGETAAAIEITNIFGSVGNYSMEKSAYDPDGGIDRRQKNGFTAPGTGDGVYSNCVTQAPTNSFVLRIRTFYNGSSVMVKPSLTKQLPFQANVIRATGYVGDTKRTVEVTKTLPQLPAIFDYAIYSGGSLTK